MRSIQLVSWALLFLVLAPSELLAEDIVDSRLQRLEETVRVLERRIALLENQSPERRAETSLPSGVANWRKLKKGMSEVDVEQLLGSPVKVDAYTSFTFWHYGGGRVQFDSNSKVAGWSEP